MNEIDKDTLDRIRKIMDISFDFKETMLFATQRKGVYAVPRRFQCEQAIERYEKDIDELMNGKVFDFWNKGEKVSKWHGRPILNNVVAVKMSMENIMSIN